MSYRLCVVTLNPLLVTVTETDVVGGTIRVARQAQGYSGSREALAAGDWAPSAGLSVEMLFDRIQRSLTDMKAPPRPGEPRFVTWTLYDPTLGYPVRTYTGPAPGVQVFDADVTTLIRMTPSPATPLEPASAGEVYGSPRRGRIVDSRRIYSMLLISGFGPRESEAAIRTLWPDQAATILEHGNSMYWGRFNWTPQAGMEGTILGTFKHPSGSSIYLMAFQYNDETLYVPIEMSAVVASQ